MGTRADFYAGVGPEAEWLGSQGWDGHPDSIAESLLLTSGESAFRKEVEWWLKSRDDATFPDDGWPWPWANSATTDYTYAFHKGQVLVSCFGSDWANVDRALAESGDDEERFTEDNPPEFPDMTDRANVAWDKRSGLIVLGGPVQ